MNPPLTRRTRTWLLWGLCAAIFLPRAFVAATDLGVIWPDEIFQTLEQAHRLAFGYGMMPWEFREGVRSWLLPGAIAPVMQLLDLLGVGSGAALAAGVKIVFAGIAALAFYPLLRVAYAAGGLFAVLILGGSAIAFPAHLIYSGRAMTELACTPLLAWGIWLLWPWGLGRAGRRLARAGFPPGMSRWTQAQPILAAGLLLGLAAVLRYQVGILLPVIAVVVALRRSLWAGALVSVGMASSLLLGGLLDWATWGSPFHSLIGYVRMNLIEGGASQWGVAKYTFYVRFLCRTVGFGMVLVVAGYLAAFRRAWPLAILPLVFLAVHTLIPHKELRFLLPVLPVLLLASAIGLAELIQAMPLPRDRRLAVAKGLGVLALLVFAIRAPGVEFFDIGQRMDSKGHGGPSSASVWGGYSERNRLFSQAGRRDDLCGLAAPGMMGYWSGGYTYLHRPVSLLWSGGPMDLEAANYVILDEGQTMNDPRYRKVEDAGDLTLYRRDGGCVAPLRSSTEYGRMFPWGVPRI